MLHGDITIYDQKKIKKGELGEIWCHWECAKRQYHYVKASKEDNKYKGIDVYINSIPTDVKATKGIYFGNLYKDSTRFVSRHPFKENTQSKDYFLLNLEDLDNPKLIYHGSIENYLIENFFGSKTNLDLFTKKVQHFDQKKQSYFNKTAINQYSIFIKESIMPLLLQKATCDYGNVNTYAKDIYFRLILRKDLREELKYIREKKKGY